MFRLMVIEGFFTVDGGTLHWSGVVSRGSAAFFILLQYFQELTSANETWILALVNSELSANPTARFSGPLLQTRPLRVTMMTRSCTHPILAFMVAGAVFPCARMPHSMTFDIPDGQFYSSKMDPSLVTSLAIAGMGLSLSGISFVAKKQGRQNWWVYLVAGMTMLTLLTLEFFGITNLLY